MSTPYSMSVTISCAKIQDDVVNALATSAESKFLENDIMVSSLSIQKCQQQECKGKAKNARRANKRQCQQSTVMAQRKVVAVDDWPNASSTKSLLAFARAVLFLALRKVRSRPHLFQRPKLVRSVRLISDLSTLSTKFIPSQNLIL